jgi:alpha-galactosidase
MLERSSVPFLIARDSPSISGSCPAFQVHPPAIIWISGKEVFVTIITVIGAGSASFGENTLAAILRSRKLRGSTLRLVDRNLESLEIVQRLAQRLNREWDSGFEIRAHAHHRQALEGSQFVVSAIEVGPREAVWRSDFEIPLRHGVRQPYAENGGPGGFVHAARNIGPVMEIVRDMEQACPQAWFINFTNPMLRICDAVNRHSRIKVAGLCHQILIGYCFVGLVLGTELDIDVPEGIRGMHADALQAPLRDRVVRQVLPLVDLRAAGTNHFTWILSMRDRRSGEDLYPLFRERFAAYDPAFEPLTRAVFDDFGLFPVPGDTHLCEYLPWMSDAAAKPWEKYRIRLYDWEGMSASRQLDLERLDDMAAGRRPVDGLLDSESEGALELIEAIAGSETHDHLAINLPNLGQVANLPTGAIVETPARVDGTGIHALHVGALPEGIAELCRRELTAARIGVDSAVGGSFELALQCLLLDPMIHDLDAARRILEDYLDAYRDYLPQYRR